MPNHDNNLFQKSMLLKTKKFPPPLSFICTTHHLSTPENQLLPTPCFSLKSPTSSMSAAVLFLFVLMKSDTVAH